MEDARRDLEVKLRMPLLPHMQGIGLRRNSDFENTLPCYQARKDFQGTHWTLLPNNKRLRSNIKKARPIDTGQGPISK